MDVYPYVYFFFSFGYLLLRTCVVSLYAASIHDESKEPRRVLYSVPSESFCSEVNCWRYPAAQRLARLNLLRGRMFFGLRYQVRKMDKEVEDKQTVSHL